MKKLNLIIAIGLIIHLESFGQNHFPESGNVGIGTGSPGSLLEVKAAIPVLSVNGTTTDALSGIELQKNGNSFGEFKINSETGELRISSGEGSTGFYQTFRTNGLERMRIAPNGYVAIGTGTPVDALHLAGDDTGIRAEGSGRARLNLLTTGEHGWQIEVGHSTGNQEAGDLGFTEAGVSGGRLVIKKGGNILIGKTTQANSTYKLDVNGGVRANEITVNTSGADFVFEDDYKLRSLEETEQFIKRKKHLPEILPAHKMISEGIGLGKLNIKLLQKIEELTLYLIEQNKLIKEQGLRIKSLENVNGKAAESQHDF